MGGPGSRVTASHGRWRRVNYTEPQLCPYQRRESAYRRRSGSGRVKTGNALLEQKISACCDVRTCTHKSRLFGNCWLPRLPRPITQAIFCRRRHQGEKAKKSPRPCVKSRVPSKQVRNSFTVRSFILPFRIYADCAAGAVHNNRT
jgi:hypothetical protein